jgi:hypothetical protein
MTTGTILLVEDNPDDEALTSLSMFWLLLNETVPSSGPKSD